MHDVFIFNAVTPCTVMVTTEPIDAVVTVEESILEIVEADSYSEEYSWPHSVPVEIPSEVGHYCFLFRLSTSFISPVPVEHYAGDQFLTR